MRLALRLALTAVLLGYACGPADDRATQEAADALSDSVAVPADAPGDADTSRAAPVVVDSVEVVFSRNEAPVAVRRSIIDSIPTLRGALEFLLRGPTAAERAAGLSSWFSDSTAGALRSVTIDDAGKAIVDFTDLDRLIPNASTSAGSSMLLQQLNGTVFQFPTVRSVEYRLNGSCEAFGEWLQYGCQVMERPD